MKKNKKKIILSSSLMVGSLIAVSTIVPAILTNQNNGFKKTNIEHQNDANVLVSSSVLNDAEQDENEYTIDHQVKIAKPNFGGPQKLYILQNSDFDPRSYHYYVYDQLDVDMQKNVVFNTSSINTANLGDQSFSATYTNKYNEQITKKFNIKVVSQQELNDVNEYIYEPYVINANVDYIRNAGGYSLGLGYDWQLVYPYLIRKGEKFSVTKVDTNAQNSQLLFMTSIGDPNQIDGNRKEGDHNVELNTEFTAPVDGYLLVKTHLTKFKRSSPTIKVSLTSKNTNQNRVKLPFYIHNSTNIDKFINEWRNSDSGALSMNNAMIWPLTTADKSAFFGNNNANSNDNVRNNFNNANNSQNELLEVYDDSIGFTREINENTLGADVKVNKRILTISRNLGSTSGTVNGNAMVENRGTGNIQIGNTRSISALFKHELGHLYQMHYIWNRYVLSETSNIFMYLNWDQYAAYKNKINEAKKRGEEITKEKEEQLRFESWRQTTYSRPYTSWNDGAKDLAKAKYYTNNYIDLLDAYNGARQYLYMLMFYKVDWKAWKEFNIMWRRVRSDMLVDAPVTRNTPNSEFMYYAFGLSSGFDVSQYMNSVGLKVDAKWVYQGLYRGWRPVVALNDVYPQYDQKYLDEQKLMNGQSLVDNSQLPKDKYGNLVFRINRETLENLRGEKIKIVDNSNSKYNVLFEKEIDSLEVEIADIPIGSYYIQMPPSKTQTTDADPFIALVTNQKTNVYDVNYKQSETSSITNFGIFSKPRNSNDSNNAFELTLENGVLISKAFWTRNLQIGSGVGAGNEYPADVDENISYKVYNPDGTLLKEYKYPANAKVLMKNSSYETNKEKSQYSYVQTRTETGDTFNEPLVRELELDFSNNQEYKLEVFAQESKNLRLFNLLTSDHLTNNNNFTEPSNPDATQPYNPNQFKPQNWSDDLRKQKTLTFTLTKEGMKLGYQDQKVAYTKKNNVLENVDFSDSEKALIKEREQQITYRYISSQISFLKSFDKQLVTVKSNLFLIKKSTLDFLNSILDKFSWTQEQLTKLNESKAYLESLLVDNVLKQDDANQSQITITSQQNQQNVWNILFEKNKYVDANGVVFSVDITNVKKTNIPFNENANVNKPGNYFIEFEVTKDGSSISWKVDVEVQ